MNTNRFVVSALGAAARLAGLAALVALAACGQKWQGGSPYVTVGGQATGLTGTLVLCQGSACSATPPGGDVLTVTGNGAFTFSLQIANGSSYVVSIRTQPVNETCVLGNASGTASGNVTSVSVSCHPNVTIGGTISGLVGTVVLVDTTASATSTLATATNGAFTFPAAVSYGASYAVTVQTQPASQTCSVAQGTGTATGTVDAVTVTCANNAMLGGTVSGLNSGVAVVLRSSTGESLTVPANGPFAFNSGVELESSYSVTVETPPTGEVCWVANDNGTATGNVTNIAVSCQTPLAPAVRPLPAIYSSGLALNYGPSRGCGSPCGEVPSVADVDQDLTLMAGAGFSLLRLFGAPEQVNAEILKAAQQNHPTLQFHLGSYLAGPNEAPGCISSATSAIQISNLINIDAVIALANEYPNVAAVSVGNETSLARNQDVRCLAYYVQIVRTFVTQPIAADDNFAFYAGTSAPATNFGGTNYVAAPEKPDTIYPLIDFVAIHEYPLLLAGSLWSTANWQQTGVAAGPARAAAMMDSSLTVAQTAYGEVSSYMTGLGYALPIAVTETGWKADQTNLTSAIEKCCAAPVNQKWFFDLMNSWLGSAGGPTAIFMFEAFDEAWKGSDNGWGLWTASRTPRYALCGTSAAGAPACTNPVYLGASYYQ